jgi:hypothetical protein
MAIWIEGLGVEYRNQSKPCATPDRPLEYGFRASARPCAVGKCKKFRQPGVVVDEVPTELSADSTDARDTLLRRAARPILKQDA